MESENPLKFYNIESSSYDSMRWFTPAGQLINAVQIEIFNDFIKNISNANFLEIAAGTGRFTHVLLEKGYSVTAVDISVSMLKKLKTNLKAHHNYKYLTIIVGDATNTKLDSSSFDGVVCFNALSHIAKHKDVFVEVYRVLKPGGLFLFNIPNYLSIYLIFGLYVNLRKKSITRNVYTIWYSFKKIKRDLEEIGFYVEEVKGQMHFPNYTPSFLLFLAKILDKSLRNGNKAKFAPIIFIKARKI